MFRTVIITFSARYFDTNNVPSKILQRQTLLTCKRPRQLHLHSHLHW